MSDTYDATIEAIQHEIVDRMQAVNDLCKLKGKPPLYPDMVGATSPMTGKILSDQWYRAGLSTAVREFLEMRKDGGLGPASVDDIYSALQAGGFKFESRDMSTAKAALKQSLTKNSSIFHRLPQGVYGLATWYPGQKNIDEDEPKAKSKGNLKKRDRKHHRSPEPPASEKNVKVGRHAGKNGKLPTMQDAVKQAIAAMSGAFTKQDVLDWVEKHQPGVKPRKDSVFVTVTRLRDEMGLVATKDSNSGVSIYRREQTKGHGAVEHERTKHTASV